MYNVSGGMRNNNNNMMKKKTAVKAHTYRLHLMSQWQLRAQLRFLLHILRQNFDGCALRSIFPVEKKNEQTERNENHVIKIDGYYVGVIKNCFIFSRTQRMKKKIE